MWEWVTASYSEVVVSLLASLSLGNQMVCLITFDAHENIRFVRPDLCGCLRFSATVRGVDFVLRLVNVVSIYAGLLPNTAGWHGVGAAVPLAASVGSSQLPRQVLNFWRPLGWELSGKWAVAGPLPQVLPLTCAAQRTVMFPTASSVPSLALRRHRPPRSVLHIPTGVSLHSIFLGKRHHSV